MVYVSHTRGGGPPFGDGDFDVVEEMNGTCKTHERRWWAFLEIVKKNLVVIMELSGFGGKHNQS